MLVIALLLLLLAVRMVLRVSSVQTWLVQRVTAYLSAELGVRVEVSKVNFRLFTRVTLDDLYIEDQDHDTLLYAAQIDARISLFSLAEEKIRVKELLLNKPRIGLKLNADHSAYNYEFLADYFSSGAQDSTSQAAWKFGLDVLMIKDATLSYRDLKYHDYTHLIDWDDIYLRKLNLEIRNIEPGGDSVNFMIHHLAFQEKSGFELRDFSAKTTVHPLAMDFQGMKILTDRSEVYSNISFDFDSWHDFNDFIHKVRWKASFDDSKISFVDLNWFAREVTGLDQTLKFKGRAKGTVDRFKAKDLEILLSEHTYFKGNVNMTGLPDIEETFMEVEAKHVSLVKKDIETIRAWPFDQPGNIVLPDNLSALGIVHFEGRFTGFYNDFVAYGNTSTDLGFISSDINLKLGEEDRQNRHSGNLNLVQFDIGKLLRLNPAVGRISMKAHIQGHGFELKTLDANVEGDISSLSLYGYKYSQISVNGHLAKRLFNGDLEVHDPNLDLDFQGDVDLRSKLPVFNFNANISNAKLANLKLIQRDTSSTFSADMSINLIGNNIDNTQGNVLLEDVSYREKETLLHFNRLMLDSRLGAERSLNFDSDVATADLTGQFNLTDLPKTFSWLLSRYLPIGLAQVKKPAKQEMHFKIKTGNTQALTDLFMPELYVADNTLCDGQFSTDLGSLNLSFHSSQFNYQALAMSGVHIQGENMGEQLNLNSSVDRLVIGDTVIIDQLKLSGKTHRDSAAIRIALNGKDSSRTSADILFDTRFTKGGQTTIALIPQKLLLDGLDWTIDGNNLVRIDSAGTSLEHFNFKSGPQEVSLSGTLSADSSRELTVQFHDFQSAQLNQLLKIWDVQVGGMVNGKAGIAAIFGKPRMNANLQVQQLSWFSDTLGDASLQTAWRSDQGLIDVHGTVTKGGDKNILVDGKYYFRPKDDLLDFDIRLQKTYLKTFSHYLDGIFSDITGVASADLKLKGTAKEPLLSGKAHLQKVGFTIDYLKTSYNFSAEVDVDTNAFRFSQVAVNDARGNTAYASGSITHHHLDDFAFDIRIKAKNNQILNTGAADNELYYGVAYASGNINISGPLDYITMDIALKSEKGTKISIPLSNPEEITASSFITFINADTSSSQKNDSGEPDFSGITLNMDFEVTPEANMYLIFDSKIGDVIEGNGHGNISMSVSPSEDFKMYGNYEIDFGKYLFTLQNVINKPFSINKGGYIRWNGDPYDAIINIDATYSLKAGLYDLFQDSSFKKLVPVDLELQLSDKLFNPTIAFDIKVQNVDPTIDNQIKRFISTEEEKYRQAVALLVMRRFTSPSELSNKAPVSSGSVVGANAYELLSNQLSNWASQLSNQVNVGFNYRPGDALTKDELEVALSTSILNDRVTIDGNVGYANTATTNNQNTTNLVGDFNVEVKVNKDGRIRLKAFNRSNNNSLINNVNSPYTQGVGVFYREEFNTFQELMQRYKELFRRKKKGRSK